MTAARGQAPGQVPAVAAALAALRRGEPVLLCDGPGPGELLIAAASVTTMTMAFLVRHTSGVACVAMEGDRLDALEIPQQASDDPGRSAFCVSVDLRLGITTGISAHDRARTALALADPATGPDDLVRPGHVLPLRVRAGGVLERPASAEAGVDLCRLAGLDPAAVLAAVEEDSAAVVGALVAVGVDDVVRFREIAESPLRAGVAVRMPTAYGEYLATCFVGRDDGAEHLALVRGDLAAPGPVLVRVHSECVVGDVLGSHRCRCSAELAASLKAITRADRGVLVYLRNRPGPGLGLRHALSASRHHDTRDDRVAAHLLRHLGVRSVVLLTGAAPGPADLAAYGIEVVGHVPLAASTTVRSAGAPPVRVG